jgi:hypothetical protein
LIHTLDPELAMSRSIFFSLLALLGGCTFNVSSFARDVHSDAPDSPAQLSADFTSINHLSGFGVRIEGDAAAPHASAVVTVAGLLGSGVDATTITNGVHVDWPVDTSATDARRLTIGYDGPQLETVWTEGVDVTLLPTTVLALDAGSTSVDVMGVTAPMRITADSGSIDVRGAGDFALAATSGSIDVTGHGGTASCSSGSIRFDLTGAVVAHATSGSIDGRFGGGGEMGCDSGSIDIELVGALDRDLTLSADSGSIDLVVPVGTSMRVETHTGSGSSHVDVGDVHSGSDDFTGTIGSGGFLVRATTSSGSISIREE